MTGAFKLEGTGGLDLYGSLDGYLQPDTYFSFNASLSNPIYGASDTVQPKSYTVYYIMRVK